MFGGLFVVSLACAVGTLIKEACEPTIPADNWANKELYSKDKQSGMPMKEIIKNAEKGRYKLPTKIYPEPHRLPDGRIIIENNLMYESDIEKYGIIKVKEWVQQGKYNLNPKELKKENERLKRENEEIGKI